MNEIADILRKYNGINIENFETENFEKYVHFKVNEIISNKKIT